MWLGGLGAYTLAWESVAYGPDDHVPGITLPASPVAGSIHPQLDTHDVYALGVSAGAWICLDMTGQAGKDADLWLLKPGCPQLPEATDSSWVAAYSDGPDSNESVKYLAQTGGTYYVVVRSGLYVSGEESWENHELTWSTPPDINIDVTPMQVALGQVIVGQTKTVSVPVKNTATLPLHLSHATLSPSAGGLSVSVNPAPVTVQPGASTVVQLRWSPSSPGALSTWLELSSDDPDTPLLRVPVLGRAVSSQTAAALSFSEQNICSAAWPQLDPAIDGDRVVWTDERHKELVTYPIVYSRDVNIWYERLGSTAESMISYGGDYGASAGPDVSGTRAAWQFYNGLTRGDTGVVAGVDGDSAGATFPGSDQIRISGNRVAYVIDRSLYAYDIPSGRSIGPLAAGCGDIDIDGQRIVYVKDSQRDDGTWDYDLYLYDLGTDTSSMISEEAESWSTPAVSGNLIVWTDERTGIRQVYVHDLSTHATRVVSPGAGAQSIPQ